MRKVDRPIEIVRRGHQERQLARIPTHRPVELVEGPEGREGLRNGPWFVLDVRPRGHRPAADHMGAGWNEIARPGDGRANRREVRDERHFPIEPRQRVAANQPGEGRDPQDDRGRRKVNEQVAAVLQDGEAVRIEAVLGRQRGGCLERSRPIRQASRYADFRSSRRWRSRRAW
jgi:hypothetical protein